MQSIVLLDNNIDLSIIKYTADHFEALCAGAGIFTNRLLTKYEEQELQ